MTYLKEHNTKEIMEHFKSSFNYFLLHYLHRSQVFYWRHNLEPGWVAGRTWGPVCACVSGHCFYYPQVTSGCNLRLGPSGTHAGARLEVRAVGGVWEELGCRGRVAYISIHFFLFLLHKYLCKINARVNSCQINVLK